MCQFLGYRRILYGRCLLETYVFLSPWTGLNGNLLYFLDIDSNNICFLCMVTLFQLIGACCTDGRYLSLNFVLWRFPPWYRRYGHYGSFFCPWPFVGDYGYRAPPWRLPFLYNGPEWPDISGRWAIVLACSLLFSQSLKKSLSNLVLSAGASFPFDPIRIWPMWLRPVRTPCYLDQVLFFLKKPPITLRVSGHPCSLTCLAPASYPY